MTVLSVERERRDSSDTASSTAELARSLMEAVSRHDLDAMEAIYAPDLVDDFVPIGTFEGRDAVLGFFVEWFAAFPDFRSEIVNLVATGETATVEWIGSGTFTGGPFQGKHPTRRRVEFRGCDIMRFEHGRLRHNTIYLDGLAYARQIGLLPAEHSVGDRLLQASFNARTDLLAATRRLPGRLGNHVGLGTRTVGPISRFVHRHDTWHAAVYPLALEKLALTPDDDYLDIACGAGGLLAQALETVDRAAGLDHSPAAIAVAQESNAATIAAGRLDLREGDARELPWPGATFDATSLLNTLHIISEPEPLLREAHRVLKPGGRFMLITQSPEALEGRMSGWMRRMLVLHGDRELEAMLRDVGFEAVEAYSPDGDIQVGYGVKAAEGPEP